jgi:hypothetical protein
MLGAMLRRLAAPAAAAALFLVAPTVRGDAVNFFTVGDFGTITGGVFTSGDSFNPAAYPPSSVATSGSVGLTSFTNSGVTNQNLTSGATASNNVETATMTIGGSTITYTNNGDHNIINAPPFVNIYQPNNTDFGTFSLNSTTTYPSGDTFASNAGFELAFYQLNPTTGQGQLVGSVVGSLTLVANNTQGSGTLTFSPTTLYIPPTPNATVLYQLGNTTTPYPGGVINLNFGGANVTTAINGSVTALPLPATASTGLALLGGLGLLTGVSALRRRRQIA